MHLETHSSIEARTIFDIIELADKRKASYCNNINSPDSKAIECLRDYLATLSEQELRELICLMDLGRDLSYGGWDQEVVDAFCRHVGENSFSHFSQEQAMFYLSGKVPLGDWLGSVMKEISEADPQSKNLEMVAE